MKNRLFMATGVIPEKIREKSRRQGESSGALIVKLVDIINSLGKTWNTITGRARYEAKGNMLSWH